MATEFVCLLVGREYSVSCSAHFTPEERSLYLIIGNLEAVIRRESLILQEIRSQSCILQAISLLTKLSQLKNNNEVI
jgi:hypothetical protein